MSSEYVELTIKLKIPREVKALIESDEIIKRAVMDYLSSEVFEKVVLIAIADSVLKDRGLTIEEVMEFDKRIKRAIVERIEKNLER